MPTYSYKCTECDTAFDAQQSFTDDALSVCPTCGGRLRKVFGSIGVSFTGSGFYRNDSRAEKNNSENGSSEKTGEQKTDTEKKPVTDATKDSATPTKTDASPSSGKKDSVPKKSAPSTSTGQAA